MCSSDLWLVSVKGELEIPFQTSNFIIRCRFPYSEIELDLRYMGNVRGCVNVCSASLSKGL